MQLSCSVKYYVFTIIINALYPILSTPLPYGCLIFRPKILKFRFTNNNTPINKLKNANVVNQFRCALYDRVSCNNPDNYMLSPMYPMLNYLPE